MSSGATQALSDACVLNKAAMVYLSNILLLKGGNTADKALNNNQSDY